MGDSRSQLLNALLGEALGLSNQGIRILRVKARMMRGRWPYEGDCSAAAVARSHFTAADESEVGQEIEAADSGVGGCDDG
jgi:hypothetical protein